jgi:hypothetical protein
MKEILVESTFWKRMEYTVTRWKLKKSTGAVDHQSALVIIKNLLEGKTCNNCYNLNSGQIRFIMWCQVHQKSRNKVYTCAKWNNKLKQ